MKLQIYIIDDDASVRTVLRHIIETNQLGDVCGEGAGSISCVQELQRLKPDIILVDLLMPTIDGIELVKIIKGIHPTGKIIMISQVSSKDMIAKAYLAGIDFYIQKPINIIEVKTVIERVKQLNAPQDTGDDRKKKLKTIFSELGVLGQAGIDDLIYMILYLKDNKAMQANYRLSDLYHAVKHKYRMAGQEISLSAIEQRLRRINQSALQNVAHMGLEDYYHPIYETYSSKLFDFSEIRQEMNYIKGKTTYPGKINSKRFIEGLSQLL